MALSVDMGMGTGLRVGAGRGMERDTEGRAHLGIVARVMVELCNMYINEWTLFTTSSTGCRRLGSCYSIPPHILLVIWLVLWPTKA